MKFLVWLLVHCTRSDPHVPWQPLFCREHGMDGKVMENKVGARSGGLRGLGRGVGLRSGHSGLEGGSEAER